MTSLAALLAILLHAPPCQLCKLNPLLGVNSGGQNPAKEEDTGATLEGEVISGDENVSADSGGLGLYSRSASSTSRHNGVKGLRSPSSESSPATQRGTPGGRSLASGSKPRVDDERTRSRIAVILCSTTSPNSPGSEPASKLILARGPGPSSSSPRRERRNFSMLKWERSCTASNRLLSPLGGTFFRADMPRNTRLRAIASFR